MSAKSPNIGELNTLITFYEYEPNIGPEPGEKEKKNLYDTWAKIDNVWLRDLEIAKANGTLSDTTIIIRDPMDDYIPSNKHYISINTPIYRDKHYNIKDVHPDFQNTGYITIVAGLVE